MIETLGYEGNRVFEYELSKDKLKLKLVEACDSHFTAELTKSEVIELAQDFLKIAEGMLEE